MERSDKIKYTVLAGLIVLALFLRMWSFVVDKPMQTNFDLHIASTIVGLFIIPLVYKITKKITGSVNAGLFSAALAIAIPLYSWRVVGQLAHTISIGFFFLTILLFIHLKEIGDWKKIIIVPLIFAFIHIYSILLIPIFGLYFLLLKLEDKKASKNELIFAGVASLFIFLIFLFFTASPAWFAVIKEYTSAHYYTIAAENFTLAKAFALAGMVPIYLGLLGTYFGLKLKKKVPLCIVSTICVFFAVMAFNVIAIILGLPYFTIALAIMAGFVYVELNKELEVSRIKKYIKQIMVLVFIIVIIMGIFQWILNNPALLNSAFNLSL